MEFIIFPNRHGEFYYARFITESCHYEPSERLGDAWTDFSRESYFLSIIEKPLIEHLCEYIAPELKGTDVTIKFSKEECHVLQVLSDDFPWCELEIIREGFCVRGEPIEFIFVLDVRNLQIGW